MTKIVITKIPNWSYHQWFLLGLYMLEEEKKIKLRFKVNFQTRMSLITNNKYILYLVKMWQWKVQSWRAPLEGYALINGRKKYFCIDRYDDPNVFSSVLLSKVDIYFKMQCPVSFDPEGFDLTDEVKLKWIGIIYRKRKCALNFQVESKPCDNLFENLHKIKPFMIGPRRLTYGNRYKPLKAAYREYLNSSRIEKSKKLMAYFGSDESPKEMSPLYNITDCNEGVLRKITHPNLKRGIAVSIIRKMGDRYDGRLITENGTTYPELIIPLPKFCDHIAQFEYNLNISGHILSIPNRFVESFMAGTAILTDKLHVKWYQPFGEEVRETVEMGYYPNEKVDWKKFEKDLSDLPKVNREKILESFHDKWSPGAAAKYILTTLGAEF
ncbi:MAG: hypothetical protein LBK58_07260 [Prevotellaceae bacterium]|jgi:hypothetical protein|nr:hypothetical protein [Prevotellaceae bacterium]